MALDGTTNVGGQRDQSHANPAYDSDGNLAVDQTAMEGPAGSLSAYPIPAGDLDKAAPLTSTTGSLDVAEGANLTTDSNGNLAVVQGGGSGLDADTVDGKQASDLGASTAEIQRKSMIHSGGFAPGFGG